LNSLIKAIYVSPLTEDWFYEIIKDVAENYGVVAPVTRSSLTAEPLK
jgi:hypothetical protein